jgi:hypothetical protein
VTELVLADGPARYLGGSIETFALPMAAFIVIATALYFIFKRPHNVPRMTYLTPASQTSIGTREPGTPGVTVVRGAVPAPAAAEAQTAVPGGPPPSGAQAEPDGQAAPGARAAPSAADQPEGDA